MDSNMQSLNYYTLQHIFSFLSWQELVTASKVCSSWNCIAMDSYLWKNICLNNTMVDNWNEFVNLINKQEVKSLNMSGMLVPSEIQDLNVFWTTFYEAIPNATKLEALELSNCPSTAFWRVTGSLHQLKKFNAFSVQNSITREKVATDVSLKMLDMKCVSDMIHLTELRISCYDIVIAHWPLTMFPRLTKLKTFSLTNVWAFDSDLFISLETDIPNLEVLEIAISITTLYSKSRNFTTFLRKLTNLRSLRLESCYSIPWMTTGGVLNQCFDAIRSLKKLKKLELIGIEFNDNLAQELAKCDGIRALLIIPTYKNEILHLNLLDCLNKLSKSLTHVVWGLTYKLDERNPCNNKLIIRSRQRNRKSVNMGSVTSFKKFLDFMMLNVKTKVIKIPHLAINGVYLSEEFDDL